MNPLLTTIQQRIIQACQMAGRNSHNVELLAVSKGQTSQSIAELFALGQKRFGENYADEMITKAKDLKSLALQWVYIGRLQSNKIAKIVAVADEIQSVAQLRHAQLIDRCAKELGKKPFAIYILVNAGNEPQKDGVSFEDLPKLAQDIAQSCSHLHILGIMAIPPQNSPAELYTQLSTAARTIGEGKLSLGMSGDLEQAIAAGSDVVRIGTALFGERAQMTRQK